MDPQAGGKPALHARLRRAIGDECTEDEEHWSFRAVIARHPIAALNRIRNAITGAGLTEGVTKRRLFLLRTPGWSGGARTTEVVRRFTEAGGRRLEFDEPDIRRLMALEGLIKKYGEETLRPWFAKRACTGGITVLREALQDVTASAKGEALEEVGNTALAEATYRPEAEDSAVVPAAIGRAAAPTPVAARVVPAVRRPADDADRWSNGRAVDVPLGEDDSDRTVSVRLEALRRHTAIFAGSGSGKTVLIRRMVEECALRGVSAIVLDPNNDLARLGDPAPGTAVLLAARRRGACRRLSRAHRRRRVDAATAERSPSELPAATRLRRDHSTIPTPSRPASTPRVAALAPHARADGRTDKAQLSRAVLREALIRFARGRSSDSARLYRRCSASCPTTDRAREDGVKLAAKMAQLLRAAMITDPLFGGVGRAGGARRAAHAAAGQAGPRLGDQLRRPAG